MRNENNILVVEPWKEETTWEDSIQMVLKETMYEAVDWIQLAQDRVQWRGPMNTLEISWPAKWLSDSEDGPDSIVSFR